MGKSLVSLCLAFILLATSAAADYTIESDTLELTVSADYLTVSVTDMRTGETYSGSRPDGLDHVSGTVSDGAIILSCMHSETGEPITVTLRPERDDIVIGLSADAEMAMSKPISFPGAFFSSSDDHYVIPYASGVFFPVTKRFPMGSFPLWIYKSTMAFAGVTDLEKGYTVISSDPWDTGFTVIQPDYRRYYSVQIQHHSTKGLFGYDRTVRLHFFTSGGHVAMCRRYRTFAEKQGWVRTFREKIAANRNVDLLRGAVDFWMPDQIRTEYFADKLEKYGFDRVLVSVLMGWNESHDIHEYIDHVTSKHWLIGRYDCFTDIYSTDYSYLGFLRTDGFPEDVIIEENGTFRKGWVTHLDDGTSAQGYQTCSTSHADYARRKLNAELPLNRYTARFMDVQYATPLSECWSPDHPLTRHGDAIHKTEAMKLVKETFNLVTGAEEARDFGFPYTDYSEGTMTIYAADGAGYNWWEPTDEPGERFVNISMNPACRMPLHGLVYHDVHAITWYTGDGFSKVPDWWETKDLFTVLYGTMPLFAPPSQYYWNTNRERFITSYHLTSAVFRRVGFEKMTSHEFLNADMTVQKTTFANGWEVVANFGPGTFSYNDSTLPPKGFIATDGREYAARREINGTLTAEMVLDNRFYYNPYGANGVFKGIGTNGPVFLEQREDGLYLAVVGDQTSLTLRPEAFTEPLSAISVINANTDDPVEIDDMGDGSYVVTLPRIGDFFTITGEPYDIGIDNTDDVRPRAASLTVSPNPFNAEVTIGYSLPGAGHVTIEVFNTLGQKIAVLIDNTAREGNHALNWRADDQASGHYIIALKYGDARISKTVTLIK